MAKSIVVNGSWTEVSV